MVHIIIPYRCIGCILSFSYFVVHNIGSVVSGCIMDAVTPPPPSKLLVSFNNNTENMIAETTTTKQISPSSLIAKKNHSSGADLLFSLSNDGTNINKIFTPGAKENIKSQKLITFCENSNITPPMPRVTSDKSKEGFNQNHKALTWMYKRQKEKLDENMKKMNIGKRTRGHMKNLVALISEAMNTIFSTRSIKSAVERGNAGKTPIIRRARKKDNNKRKINDDDINDPIERLIPSKRQCLSSPLLQPRTNNTIITTTNSNTNKENIDDNDYDMAQVLLSIPNTAQRNNIQTHATTNSNSNKENIDSNNYDVARQLLSNMITNQPKNIQTYAIANSKSNMITKKRSKASTYCMGIRYGKDHTDHTAVLYLLSKLFRDALLRMESSQIFYDIPDDCYDPTATVNNTNKHKLVPIQDFINRHYKIDEDFYICRDPDTHDVVFHSKKCKGITAVSLAERCDACSKIRNKLWSLIRYAIPRYAIPRATARDKKENIRYVIQHPTTARRRIIDDNTRYLKLLKECVKLRFDNKLLRNLISCKKGSEFEAGVEQCMKSANDLFDDYQSKHNTTATSEEKSEERALWEISLEHLTKVKTRNGKMHGIRCHPVILQFAITILAKTSQKTYRLIQPMLKLPHISHILRIQQERGGGQDERQSILGVINEGCRAMGEQYDILGIFDDIRRKIHLSYDSIVCAEGFDFNIHHGAVGIDTHLNFNVIKAKFRKLVRMSACRLNTNVLLFFVSNANSRNTSLYIRILLTGKIMFDNE